MTNPNRVNVAVPGSDAPAIFYDFTNSLGTGAGNTAGPVAPIEWVIPTTGPTTNAFSKKDWFSYMQNGSAATVQTMLNSTTTSNTVGAVMILGVSVLTS